MRRFTILAAGLLILGCDSGKPDSSEAPGSSQKGIEMIDFGTVEGKSVKLFTLTNGAITAKITNYGTILTELHVPDKDGKTADVVLGFDTLDLYLKGHPFFGATAGRVANRIANGAFSLDGKDYTLAKNNGPHSLHGGTKGFVGRLPDRGTGLVGSLPCTSGPT